MIGGTWTEGCPMFILSDGQKQENQLLTGKEGGKGCSSLATVTTILEDLCLFKLTDGCTSCTSILISREYFYNIKLRSFKILSFTPASILHRFIQM